MANRFTPISSNSNLPLVIAALNRNFQSLDSQTYTDNKQIAGGGSIKNGKLPDGTYGTQYSDNSGERIRIGQLDKDNTDKYDLVFSNNSNNQQTRQILLGQHPVDGHMGLWITKPGIDAIDALEE